MAHAKGKAAALAMPRHHPPVAVLNWCIFSGDLIACPLLPSRADLTFASATHAVIWHFDKDSPAFVETLGAAIAARHAIPRAMAIEAGMAPCTVADLRRKLRSDLRRVRSAFEVPAAKWSEWQAWLADDSYWPLDATVAHGDLYAGHVMARPDSRVGGMIDWIEARLGDLGSRSHRPHRGFRPPSLARAHRAPISRRAAMPGRASPGTASGSIPPSPSLMPSSP